MNLFRPFFAVCLFAFPALTFSQEQGAATPAQMGFERGVFGNASPYTGMSPNMLLRLRNDLTMELREIQRTLGYIDPKDTRFAEVLKTQQTEAIQQLKEIEKQLQTQGISETEAPKTPSPWLQMQQFDSRMPQPQMPDDSRNPLRVLPQQMEQQPITMPHMQPHNVLEDSPWTPKPAKEIVELKQSVTELQNEVMSLREQIKSLETQIQLLTRSILNSTARQ